MATSYKNYLWGWLCGVWSSNEPLSSVFSPTCLFSLLFIRKKKIYSSFPGPTLSWNSLTLDHFLSEAGNLSRNYHGAKRSIIKSSCPWSWNLCSRKVKQINITTLRVAVPSMMVATFIASSPFSSNSVAFFGPCACPTMGLGGHLGTLQYSQALPLPV